MRGQGETSAASDGTSVTCLQRVSKVHQAVITFPSLQQQPGDALALNLSRGQQLTAQRVALTGRGSRRGGRVDRQGFLSRQLASAIPGDSLLVAGFSLGCLGRSGGQGQDDLGSWDCPDSLLGEGGHHDG